MVCCCEVITQGWGGWGCSIAIPGYRLVDCPRIGERRAALAWAEMMVKAYRPRQSHGRQVKAESRQ